MNDEIKEIDALLFYLIHTDRLKQEKKQYIADYITNLQQLEQEYKKINGELREENNKLEIALQNIQEDYDKRIEENKRLKETNVYCNRTDCVGRIKDSRKYDSVYQEKEDYKSRCEKAIEYVNENKHLSMFADCREPEEDWNYDLECSANDLLNILQNGSDSQ